MIQRNKDGLWTCYCDHCGVDYYKDGFECDGYVCYGWQEREGIEADLCSQYAIWTRTRALNGLTYTYCPDCFKYDENDDEVLRADRKDLYEGAEL